MDASYRLVVGVDGSEGGRRALLWAVKDAAARGGTVQVVGAWRWDTFDLPPRASTRPEDERDRVERVVAADIEALPGLRGVAVASEVVEGRPADVLTAAARDADLLVLGSHGHSRVWHTVLGSVVEECIRKAACPVVVVPVPHPVSPAPAEPAVRAR